MFLPQSSAQRRPSAAALDPQLTAFNRLFEEYTIVPSAARLCCVARS
jgi:hypothetical protein